VLSTEAEVKPSDSGSLAKRQWDESPVHASPPGEGSPEIELSVACWETLAEDIEMGTVPDEMLQVWRGVGDLHRCMEAVIDELKVLKHMLINECEIWYGEQVKVDAERKWVEQERMWASDSMCNMAQSTIRLQQMLVELLAEGREE